MAGSIDEVANVKILLVLALFVSFLVSPTLAWWNSNWQTRYNVTLDLVNTSRRTTDIFWNFTAFGVTATNCTKEIRLTTDTDVEIPSWSYSQEANGTNKNCVVAALVNQTSMIKNYWLYSNYTDANSPIYANPFTISGGTGLGSLQGSINTGSGMTLSWGSKLIGDTIVNAPSFLLEIGGTGLTYNKFHTGGGNDGALFRLNSSIFGTAGLTCNITLNTPIFVDLSCWGIAPFSGWRTSVILYRNLPYVDMRIFNGTSSDVAYDGGPASGITPTGIYGAYDNCASDDMTSQASKCDTPNTQSPRNWAGWYSPASSNMMLLFGDYKHPTAQSIMTLAQNGWPTYLKSFTQTGPTGAPKNGWFERLISWINSGAIVSNLTGVVSYAFSENITYNVPLLTSINGTGSGYNTAPNINSISTNPQIPISDYSNIQTIVSAIDNYGVTSLALNWTWPNSTKSNIDNLTQNGDIWTSSNFSIDQFGVYSVKVTACDITQVCVSSTRVFSVLMNSSTTNQNPSGNLNLPTDIGHAVTIRLNYTKDYNFTTISLANTNVTIFDTTTSRTVLSPYNPMTYISSLGLWQFNWTVPTGINGTYKYNIKGNVSGLYGSDFDINGTFDTKDTTAPQIAGASVMTSCSGYSNYRLANSPLEVTFSATDNWQIGQNSSFCNFTMSNYTSAISQITASNCSFPSVGPAGSASVRIWVNDTVNNTASATLGITVVDSCPVQPTTPTPSISSGSGSGSSGGGGGGGGGGNGGSLVATTISEGGLPEIIFESRALSLVQEQPERVKITLKNPKNEPLRVTLDGPPEVSFDGKEFTLSPGGEKDVYATFSYLTAGEYKPMISAQLGDLKRMYDLSVTVVKREADAVGQLLIDAQKAVNSLILLKYKACEEDVNAVKSKAIAIETLAGDLRSAYLLSKGTTPSAAKIEELKLELSALSRFTDKIEECKPTVIIQQKSTVNEDGGVQTSKKAGNLIPVMAILVLLFGFGLFRFLGKV